MSFISWSNITNVELVYTLGRVPCRNKSSNKAQQANSFKRLAFVYPHTTERERERERERGGGREKTEKLLWLEH